MKIRENLKYYFLGGLFLGTILVWYAVYAESQDKLLVAFLDVGQGDAIFIQTPSNNQILLDGGPNKKVLSELSKIMPFYDRSIDMIIESHPDSDHIAGLIDVAKRYEINSVMETGVDSDSDVYKTLENVIKEKNIQKVLARKGMRINFGDGAYLDILFPDRDVSGLETNTSSIVAKLIYGDNSFIFTGDSPQAIEKYLASTIGVIPAGRDKILKLGHHGSKTSTLELFLGYVNPKYAIISVGKDNKYGHPSKETMDLLNRFKIPTFRTDELGTIKIKSDGQNLQIE